MDDGAPTRWLRPVTRAGATGKWRAGQRSVIGAFLTPITPVTAPLVTEKAADVVDLAVVPAPLVALPAVTVPGIFAVAGNVTITEFSEAADPWVA